MSIGVGVLVSNPNGLRFSNPNGLRFSNPKFMFSRVILMLFLTSSMEILTKVLGFTKGDWGKLARVS